MLTQLVIFDWDGTLMDSTGFITSCVQEAATELGFTPPESDVVINVIGLGLNEALSAVLPEISADEQAAFVKMYRKIFFAKTSPNLFEGAIDTLDRLLTAGYSLAVATGKGRLGLDKVLDDTGIGHYFCYTKCADETQSKPHPEMLYQILAESSVAPENALMVGDTEYDILMAKCASVPALGVSYGAHAKERILNLDPVGCIDDIRELQEWLKNKG